MGREAEMKVAEIYESIQGEGPHVGQPTTFVRFGGCNLRCPGWGSGLLPDGTEVLGCDTIFAVYPEWRHTWESKDVADIVGPIDTENVTLTGGEPFIQRSKELEDLHSLLFEEGHTIDIFTNGSQVFPEWVSFDMVTLIVDYKLPGSGEYGAFNEDNIKMLGNGPQHLALGLVRPEKHAMKFVCKDEHDFMVAIEDIDTYKFTEFMQIFFGVVWDVEFTAADLAPLIMEHAPYAKLNIQTHNLIWPVHERRR